MNPVRYIPAGAVKISDKKSDAVAYLYANKQGKPCMRVFYGKQGKPVANYRYLNEAQRAADLVRYFADRQETLGRVAAAARRRKAFANPYKVGDLFKSVWGYDQTNVDWYEVVGSKGKTLTMRKIATESVATGDMTGKCVPLPGSFIGDEFKRVAQDGFVKMASYSNAYFQPGQTIAGVKVYEATAFSSYA